MKHSLLILGIFFISTLTKAQTVENIHTKQVGEKINIYYQIKNSWDDQFFEVTISCLINNSKKIGLKSISGDVGNNIIGGKDEYRAVWDVLKDVDELTNAEFFVQIEQKDDGTIINPVKTTEGFNPFKYKKENKGQFFLAYQFFYGGKFGYMGKFGASVTVGAPIPDEDFTIYVSLTKSIIKTQHFQWNLYPLVGVDFYYPAIIVGGGTETAIGHLYLNFDGFVDMEDTFFYFMTGIGWRF